MYGSPIVFGMLLPNPAGNVAQTVGWQVLNQGHNAAVNYANRNASAPSGTAEVVGAGALSVSAGFLLAAVIPASTSSQPTDSSLTHTPLPPPKRHR